ncbi:phage tail protein [Paenibacillus albicereus]|uniref:Phage tail protein n=1 Tax=Paenibacillus albicereus TaxID=2726185 RepID=A0A6H2GYL7_9BACL|nr:tail fiber protein [Paenibacillus albicereus]QJC52510.1 phage tail protein [Paenibacillus albicereus]
MDPYIGEIRMFAGTFAPRGWAFCDGTLLAIRANTALFSILGNIYGGDGITTFALPDLRGRAPMHKGQGPGLTERLLGQMGGEQAAVLTEAQLPPHTHAPACQSASGNLASPEGAVWSKTTGRSGPPAYGAAPNAPMNPEAIGAAGSGQLHNNMQPYLGIPFIICLEGIFPPRG